MISYIHIKNFKSLKNCRLKPAHFNLFFGMNGMGKSSFLQVLLLLRQSYQKAVLENEGLLLNDKDCISLGTGRDVFYQGAGKDDLLHFEIHTENSNKFTWSFGYEATSDILPLKQGPLKTDPLYSSAFKKLSLFNTHFQYLSAEHYGPQMSYPKSELIVKQNRNIGVKGEYAVHYLSVFGNSETVQFKNLLHDNAHSNTLLNQVTAWLGEISPGTKLVVEDIRGIDSVRLGIKFETRTGFTNDFSPANTGFGILYVLPVIVSLLKAEPDSIILMENPESHLHPKGQSAIGRLMALAAQNGVQIFCESHSDHIINGARVAIKESMLEKDKLAIYYFDRKLNDDEHKTRITEIFVDSKGELSAYPDGLLDEWNNLLMKLI